MAMSRSQVSQQLVYLLQQSGAFGASASVFEASLNVENFLANNLTFPIAAVVTRDFEYDMASSLNRIKVARFAVSVASGHVTEALKANYLASGGSSSSQRSLEVTIRALYAYLGSSSKFVFTPTFHGFQGQIVTASRQRLVPAQGTTFDVCDLHIDVYDVTTADYYAPCYRLAGAAAAAHAINLSWTNPGGRFDDHQNVLRRGTNPGDAAPTTIIGGTGITVTGGVQGVAAADASPSGSGQTYNYALFRTYNSGANVSVACTVAVTTT